MKDTIASAAATCTKSEKEYEIPLIKIAELLHGVGCCVRREKRKGHHVIGVERMGVAGLHESYSAVKRHKRDLIACADEEE